jgi:hypothetical protein
VLISPHVFSSIQQPEQSGLHLTEKEMTASPVKGLSSSFKFIFLKILEGKNKSRRNGIFSNMVNGLCALRSGSSAVGRGRAGIFVDG